MAIRRLVGIIGLVIGLAGLTEIVFPVWALNIAAGLFHIVPMIIAGSVGAIIGIVLVIAAIRNQVGLKPFVLAFGAIVIVVSMIAIAEPGLIRDMGYALLLRRSWNFQLIVLWITGLIRMAIGGLLLYAAAKGPR